MKICNNFKNRLLGLMFKKEIKEDLLFPNCRSIHTFFMKFNIDVIAIDKNGIVIKVYKNVPPNRIIFCPKKTYAIIETKANSDYQENMYIKDFKS